jgi:hypothetical protein
MRFQFLVGLLMALLVAGTYWYETTKGICPAPVAYRLGQLDGEFGLTSEAALSYMNEAESLWEEAANRELFVYDEQATFVVNFVFDERQEFADTEVSQTRMLNEQRQKNEEVMSQVESLQAEHQKLKASYEEQTNQYESDLRSYTETVEYYNNNGGAPEAEYKALQRKEAELDEQASELAMLAEELNAKAEEINTLGQQGNEMLAAYNEQVTAYNQKYGYTREFTQGDYRGDNINIYKFSSDQELVTVLTHEFGHSLGLDHVEGESSVMYYLLADTNGQVALSEEDKAALTETCGTGSDIESNIRRYIRDFLAILNI